MQSVPFYLTPPPIRIRCRYTRAYNSSCKVPVTYKISTKHETDVDTLRKTPLKQKFTKIRPLGAELFHANGQTYKWTDMTKLTSVSRKWIATAPMNGSWEQVMWM